MKLQHMLMAVVVAAIWGLNFVIVKAGLEEMPPFIYGAGRFFIAALPVFFLKKPDVSWKIIGGIGLILGTLKFALMFMGVYLGMSAGVSSLVLQSQVFFTVALSMVIFKCRIRKTQLLGMLVAAMGIILIATQTKAEGTFIGFLLILGSAASWAVSNIIYQKAGNVDMFALTVWTSIIPPIPMLLGAFMLDGPDVLGHVASNMSWVSIGCLLFTACASTWLGTTWWGVLLKRYEAPRVAPYALLTPIFGITFAWLFLGEDLSYITLAACALVFVGLVINQWSFLKRYRAAQRRMLAMEQTSPNLDQAA